MFEYTLQFRNTTAHANVDVLSRLPLPAVPAVNQTPPELVHTHAFLFTPNMQWDLIVGIQLIVYVYVVVKLKGQNYSCEVKYIQHRKCHALVK